MTLSGCSGATVWPLEGMISPYSLKPGLIHHQAAKQNELAASQIHICLKIITGDVMHLSGSGNLKHSKYQTKEDKTQH